LLRAACQTAAPVSGPSSAFSSQTVTHLGFLLFCASGTPMYAPEAGRMVSLPRLSQGGNACILQGTASGRCYYFAH
jgi:hypothetical protein